VNEPRKNKVEATISLMTLGAEVTHHHFLKILFIGARGYKSINIRR
jgi:hypothetical protein